MKAAPLSPIALSFFNKTIKKNKLDTQKNYFLCMDILLSSNDLRVVFVIKASAMALTPTDLIGVFVFEALRFSSVRDLFTFSASPKSFAPVGSIKFPKETKSITQFFYIGCKSVLYLLG